MRVALVKGRSQYGVLRALIDEAAQGFVERGWSPTILDLADWPGESEFRAMVGSLGALDMAFSINILGDSKFPDGTHYSAVFGCPLVLQYVDCPLYPFHTDRLENTRSSTALLFPDARHVEDVRKIHGPDRFRFIGFGPHAGAGGVRPLPDSGEAYLNARPIPILFAGSNMSESAPPWRSSPERMRLMFDQAADLALGSDTLHSRDALETVLRSYGFDVDSEDARPTMVNLWRMAYVLEDWVRARRRQQFFAAAARVGLPLTIYGAGYDDASARYDGFTYHEPVEFQEILRLMGQSRMVMNATAVFAHGSHERPLSAMLAGAVAVSDYSQFFADSFVHDREMLLFRWSHLEEDLQHVRARLDDGTGLADIARAGQRKAATHHRWANRVDGYAHAAQAVSR